MSLRSKNTVIARSFIAIALLHLFFSTYIVSQASITLSIQDMNNQLIKQAMIQAPFILQVELNEIEAFDEVRYIPGMDNFKYSPAMRYSRVSMNDGKSITKIFYRFVLQSDKKGVFTVGPFALRDKFGQMVRSNRLIVPVKETVASDKMQAPKYMVKSKLDKKSVYIGEKVTLHVQFFDRIFVDNPSIIVPEFEYVNVLQIREKSDKNIWNDHGYDYAMSEWDIDFYPTAQGKLIIDGIKVKFLDQRLEQTSLSRGAFRRFGSMVKVPRDLQARPIELQVVDLPYDEKFKEVKAIGQFYQLRLSVDKNSAQQGEGIILAIELFGDGNFEMMKTLPLILPDGLCFYDADTIKIDEDRKYKHTEFIIQAQAAGSYHISPQQIDYFDPIDGRYKTLLSNSLDICITENEIVQSSQDYQSLTDEIKQNNNEIRNVLDRKILKKDSLFQLKATKNFLQWYKKLLDYLFFILFIMIVYRFIIEKYILAHNKWQHFSIFFKAIRACRCAALKKNQNVLHALFIRLFVALKVGSLGEICDEMIEQYLKEMGFSCELITEWNRFNKNLLKASFAQPDHTNTSDLFKESLTWIQRLKEKI